RGSREETAQTALGRGSASVSSTGGGIRHDSGTLGDGREAHNFLDGHPRDDDDSRRTTARKNLGVKQSKTRGTVAFSLGGNDGQRGSQFGIRDRMKKSVGGLMRFLVRGGRSKNQPASLPVSASAASALQPQSTYLAAAGDAATPAPRSSDGKESNEDADGARPASIVKDRITRDSAAEAVPPEASDDLRMSAVSSVSSRGPSHARSRMFNTASTLPNSLRGRMTFVTPHDKLLPRAKMASR
ncbi:unnamed protein product, partial [Amoebophrya sp. A25]